MGAGASTVYGLALDATGNAYVTGTNVEPASPGVRAHLVAGLPQYSFNFFNAPGSSGYYQRWVIVQGPDGSTVCTTNVASVFFQ